MSSYSNKKLNEHLDYLYKNLRIIKPSDRVDVLYFLKKRDEGFQIQQDNIVEISNLAKKYDPSHRKWLEDNRSKLETKFFIDEEAEVTICINEDSLIDELKETIAKLNNEIRIRDIIIRQYEDTNKHIQGMIRR